MKTPHSSFRTGLLLYLSLMSLIGSALPNSLAVETAVTPEPQSINAFLVIDLEYIETHGGNYYLEDLVIYGDPYYDYGIYINSLERNFSERFCFFQFSNITFSGFSNGVALYINGTFGLSVIGCNFINNKVGINYMNEDSITIQESTFTNSPIINNNVSVSRIEECNLINSPYFGNAINSLTFQDSNLINSSVLIEGNSNEVYRCNFCNFSNSRPALTFGSTGWSNIVYNTTFSSPEIPIYIQINSSESFVVNNTLINAQVQTHTNNTNILHNYFDTCDRGLWLGYTNTLSESDGESWIGNETVRGNFFLNPIQYAILIENSMNPLIESNIVQNDPKNFIGFMHDTVVPQVQANFYENYSTFYPDATNISGYWNQPVIFLETHPEFRDEQPLFSFPICLITPIYHNITVILWQPQDFYHGVYLIAIPLGYSPILVKYADYGHYQSEVWVEVNSINFIKNLFVAGGLDYIESPKYSSVGLKDGYYFEIELLKFAAPLPNGTYENHTIKVETRLVIPPDLPEDFTWQYIGIGFGIMIGVTGLVLIIRRIISKYKAKKKNPSNFQRRP